MWTRVSPCPSYGGGKAAGAKSVSLAPYSDQGLTLVHVSAQRQHMLWDMLGA